MTNNKILSVIQKYSMLSHGDTVVIGVSGGADSMCLLHFFNEISSKFGLNIICAHVNHGIRGTEADRDEAFVRDFCRKNSIGFCSVCYNVPEIASTTGESEELCGRRLRYEFFSSIAENAKIATAHNLNDCAETFLFNLTRGTGLKGLTGIPPVRGNIIRPLIECTRAEIESYLEENGVSYVTDSTNLDDEYSRNKIRHKVLPVLTELNPSFPAVLLRCMSSLNNDEEFLEKNADAAFRKMNKNETFSVSGIILLDEAIRNRVLIKIADAFGARDISYRHVELLNELLLKSGAVMLPGDVTIVSDGTGLYKKKEEISDVSILEKYKKEKSIYQFPSCRLKIEAIDKSDINIYNNSQLPFLNYADADALENAVFRSRLPGDRFRFPNAEHSKSLKNLFKEKNISPADRFGIPMLADENNILWINGVGVSEFAKVTVKTKNIVKIIVAKQ